MNKRSREYRAAKKAVVAFSNQIDARSREKPHMFAEAYVVRLSQLQKATRGEETKYFIVASDAEVYPVVQGASDPQVIDAQNEAHTVAAALRSNLEQKILAEYQNHIFLVVESFTIASAHKQTNRLIVFAKFIPVPEDRRGTLPEAALRYPINFVCKKEEK